MDFNTLMKDIKYDIEHPKCKRCGKELYIPRPQKHIYEKWGIMAWTAFVKQYAKHNGWYELENLNRNLVCGECLKHDDVPNRIMLESYDTWIEKYNKWKNELNIK
jgi:hypothetical protein|nr:MAG TPA: Protein of unknown function (DUF2688) [Caudoviricetes sp.]